jgi:universal stress protein A
MLPVETVLCPVDFSPVSEGALRLATRLCRRFSARLVLEHNLLPGPPSYLTVSWMWSETHPEASHAEAEAERRLKALLATLPREVRPEAKLTRGPLDEALLFLARQLSADLIVMGSHGAGNLDHRSVTEQILAAAPCPVLTWSEGQSGERLLAAGEGEGASLATVVPVDFSDRSAAALAYAWGLAERLPLAVHLVHVAGAGERLLPAGAPPGQEVEAAKARLAALVPARFARRASWRVVEGEPGEAIAGFAREVGADLIVMGVRGKRLLARPSAGAAACQVLHGSACPVWFVPAGRGQRDLAVPADAAPAVA